MFAVAVKQGDDVGEIIVKELRYWGVTGWTPPPDAPECGLVGQAECPVDHFGNWSFCLLRVILLYA